MRILVTGGAGFIGSQLTAQLLQRNHDVIVLDNFDDYYNPAVKRANIAALGYNPHLHVIEGDIRNDVLVDEVFHDYAITHVVHLAALPGVRSSINKARLYTDVNLNGSLVLMDAAAKYGVELFIQASTSSVYGNTSQIPFRECDSGDQPLAPYPASKRSAELYAHSYHQLHDMNLTMLRFFNVYGPQGRPDMMPMRVIDSILKQQPIPLFAGGSLERDWTYIDDTVAGILAALERPMGYQVINLGYGSPIPLTRFIEIYERLIGKQAITYDVPAPRSEPNITYCDNRLACELLGFAPKISIEVGLARTWDWYQSRFADSRDDLIALPHKRR